MEAHNLEPEEHVLVMGVKPALHIPERAPGRVPSRGAFYRCISEPSKMKTAIDVDYFPVAERQ